MLGMRYKNVSAKNMAALFRHAKKRQDHVEAARILGAIARVVAVVNDPVFVTAALGRDADEIVGAEVVDTQICEDCLRRRQEEARLQKERGHSPKQDPIADERTRIMVDLMFTDNGELRERIFAAARGEAVSAIRDRNRFAAETSALKQFSERHSADPKMVL